LDQKVVFDQALIRRYDVAGPRYTSYPTAVQFDAKFDAAAYRVCALQGNATRPPRPLSLYFHIPFCARVCFYCGCTKIVTKNRTRAAPYLARLHRELELQSRLFDYKRRVDQLHWGGGTPTFLSHAEMRALMDVTRRYFALRSDDHGEYGVEIDPRESDAATIALLRDLGFNRMSIGVQDFDPRVQRAVNRVQSEVETFSVLDGARKLGFRSINIDLIYGLPHQTVISFGRTLEKIIEAAPDRLSVYNYAHLPGLFKTQRRIQEADLPGPAEKLDILQLTIERLTQAGYVYVGMDHFAKSDDELALAQRNGTLHRNFQGYSTRAGCDLIGFGLSAISMVGDSYSQNVRTLDDYYDRLDAGNLPVARGVALNRDDRVRRAVIMQLVCRFHLDVKEIERKFVLDFREYFSVERRALEVMRHDGLIEIGSDTIHVTPKGRLLIRNLCMVFDTYLRERTAPRFSRAI
jgi:oxygen-independent coproporphyrinogen-3 oxidase